ncbi:MAG: putative sulfate exporter family transporter [Solirubrobacteraceae bacterium]|nr:putative sulfate exporter family transporter [Solirubrobacteraceae bacterium]
MSSGEALSPAARASEGAELDKRPLGAAWIGVGLLLVLALAWLTRYLEEHASGWFGDSDFVGAVEYPVYAIALGLAGSFVIGKLGVRDRLSPAFRTEFFIKTGLVLLGASINISVIVRAAGPAIAQAVILVTAVFLFAWWLGGRLGLDDKLRALLASAVSICGVSAAIAAAGAVRATREQIAYTASLVILFALPSIFLLPWLVDVLGLSNAVAGAWIGGNIDTTAAVAASGAIVGEESLQIATIVKASQNVLMGVVAVALTAYFTLRVERRQAADGAPADVPRQPSVWIQLWDRFPKFVLGFIAASLIGTWFLEVASDPDAAKATIGVVNDYRTWFLALAFVSIGLEFQIKAVREAGWRPIAVFGGAAAFNLLLGLLLASILFAGFAV